MMKTVFCGMLIAIALWSPASAADIDANSPVYAKAAPPLLHNWTGLYAGVHAGYERTKSTDTISGATPGGVDFLFVSGPNPIGLDPKGFLGGGQVGYNWQISPWWVVGFEADIAGVDAKQQSTVTGRTQLIRTYVANEQVDWIGTVRGRIGIVPTDRLLAYFTGGLAYGQASLSTALISTGGSGCAGNRCENGSVAGTKAGWTIGGGLEWAFNNNWSLKAEYLYYDLGSISHNMIDPNFPADVFLSKAHLTGSITRGGINYHF